jgi:hypothetical protein
VNSCADSLTRSSRDRIAGVRCPNESTVRRIAQVGHTRFDTKQEDGRTPATVARQSSGHPCCFLLSEASSPSPARTAGSVAAGSALTPVSHAPRIISNSTATHTHHHSDSRCRTQGLVQREPLSGPRDRRRASVHTSRRGDLSVDGLRTRRAVDVDNSPADNGDSRCVVSTGERVAWPSPRGTRRRSRAGMTPARTRHATGDRGAVTRSWRVATRRGGGSRP